MPNTVSLTQTEPPKTLGAKAVVWVDKVPRGYEASSWCHTNHRFERATALKWRDAVSIVTDRIGLKPDTYEVRQ